MVPRHSPRPTPRRPHWKKPSAMVSAAMWKWKPYRAAAAHPAHGQEPAAKLRQQITAELEKLARKERQLSDLHNIRIRATEEGLFVHYHCRFAPETSVQTVHDVVEPHRSEAHGCSERCGARGGPCRTRGARTPQALRRESALLGINKEGAGTMGMQNTGLVHHFALRRQHGAPAWRTVPVQ